MNTGDSLASLASLLAAVARTPRVPPVLPGTQIAARYQIVGVVGAGGMGVVYRARDEQLLRDVAVKLCSRLDGEEDRRLYGEALAMARLAHPNVITVYEVGRFGDDLFLVMELADGPTLRRWLAQHRRPWREIVRRFVDAAHGLAAVHHEGLVHGDFKPDNVVVGGDGRVRLLDFGLARVGDMGATNGVGGTPRYMAPELRDGWMPSQRSDQYAFCVALSEALGGARRTPRAIARILARGLSEEPNRRWDSVDDLAAALAERLVVRRRALVVSGAALALALLAVGAVGVARSAEATRQRELAMRRAALERDVELGRQELAGGNAQPALVYLAAALEGGVDRPGVRYLLARGLAALEQSFVELPGGGAPVTAVAIVRLGPRALVGTRDGRLAMYDATTGRLLRAATARDGAAITAIAVDPAASRVLVASAGGTAWLEELDGGLPLAAFVGHGGALVGARFVAGGRRVLTWSDDGTARVWDATGRELSRIVHEAPVRAAVEAADAAFLATASDDGTARIVPPRGAPRVLRHPAAVVAIDVDAGGTQVATAAADGVVRVWDRRTGARVAELRHPELPGAVRFLPGGRLLTTCHDGVARVWDVATASVLVTLAGHAGPISGVDITADGARAITGSLDATVRAWDLATGRQLAALVGHAQPVVAVAAVAQGGLVLSGARDGAARAWSVAPRDLVGSLPGGERRFRGAWYAADGVVALDEDGALAYWRARASGWQRDLDAIAVGLRAGTPVAVSPDGLLLAFARTGGGGGVVELWDLDASRRVVRRATGGAVRGLAFSRDGRTLVAHGDGAWVWWTAPALAGWPLEPLALRRRLSSAFGPSVAAALTPDGARLVMGHESGAISFWDLRELRLVDAVPHPEASAQQLAFDATGTLLGVAGNDASVQVWDGFTGRLRRRLGRHGAPVEAVRFSPDGALVYSLGSDRRVRVWELAGDAELGSIAVDAFGGLDLSRDGSRLLVHQHLGAVTFWDVSREPRPAARVAEVVACLVPFEVGEDGRVVARKVRPVCD